MTMTMKAARANANMTQQEVADKMGVHVQTYQKLERNPENATIKEAKLFATIVGLSFTDIFFGPNSN
ncbi:MAG: helix-turn-helix transcriptional regulator [Hornefia butyriciproducens]|uniref:helix-turn-helix transcriptional regulator n=1 Tax=Hornefia butyriciproducens TaxID=2652293 RepID=UPI002A758247|nr:helix-turn-helix transcriptional regulator [Hornefia butyriciproducens]MDY2991747.1 helix-turn-helix transcriptional regulator [Hornefia butyriciproducens]